MRFSTQIAIVPVRSEQTGVQIDFFDQNGFLGYECLLIGQTAVVDLDNLAWLPEGFSGSMVIEGDGPIAVSVNVQGDVFEDRLAGYEALPIQGLGLPSSRPRCW